VYLHQGETYLVLGFDLRAGVAVVRPAPSLGYTTAPRVQSSVTIRRVRQEQGWGAAHVHFGDVRVTAQAVGYLRRRSGTGEVIGEVALDLPERHLDTSSVWFTLDPDAVACSGIVPGAVAGAAHAAEHAAISLLPLVASCDRWDVGGLSIREHPQTGTVTVFVHDGLPGGAGLAERAFGTAEHWLAATRTAIATCRCEDGCPSCVQSPKCGNGNNPLDKQAAVHLLDAVLADAPATRPDPPQEGLPVH
jgi:DEAD/DEAH box helicase domain-containing protein